MGIDVYLAWKGQTEAEHKAQITGFRIDMGHIGYLHEAYHGGPYATMYLIREDWDHQPAGGFTISAAELKKRLPATVMVALYRDHAVYGEGRPDLIELDGIDPEKIEEAVFAKVADALAEAAECKRMLDEYEPNEEQARAVSQLIATRSLPDVALSFVDFVVLAERKEAETGEPVRIIVSA